MSYQGARARPMASESGRVFEVSRVAIGPDGRISRVLWSEVGAKSDADVGARFVVAAADVVDAIHAGARVAAVFEGRGEPLPERILVVVEHDDGQESLAFEDGPSPGREMSDIATLVA
jgi:hypothetical protein